MILQTFVKTINGHILEFNRLLFPLKYNVLDKDIESKGGIFTYEKNDSGIWWANELHNLPTWMRAISLEVHDVIERNEEGLLHHDTTLHTTVGRENLEVAQ